MAIFRALSAESRARIVELLAQREMNINELSAELSLAQPSITKHIQALEEAGLVVSDYLVGTQGMQKRCRLVHDRITIDFAGPNHVEDWVSEIEVPVGLYTRAEVRPTCGLASRDRMVGIIDVPLSFFSPDRAKAEILWTGGGNVEYAFPNSLPLPTVIDAIEFIAELGSEAPGYENDYPSDITMWINGVDIGHWTSPGDPGGERGKLNPAWWQDYMNQHGFLTEWRVDSKGSFVNGQQISDVTISQVNILPFQATMIKLGIKEDAKNQGGLTIFGKGFGSFEQDLLLRVHHTNKGGDIPANLKWHPPTDV